MTAPRKGSLFVIFLTVFIDLLGFGIVLPLLPIYGKEFARGLDLTAEQTGIVVGMLMASFSAMQFVFMPIWGRASDRWGRRPILLIGLAGSTFFYGLFGVATSLRSLTGLFITRIGAGIAGATIATAQAYIADTTTKENRAKGMALIGAAFALGFTLGPSLGIIALLFGGDVAVSPWPGYLASALSGAALLLAIALLPESHAANAASERRPLFDWVALENALATPSIALLLLSSFIAIYSFANFESTLSLQIDGIMANSAEGVPASSILSWLINRARSWGYEEADEIRLIVIFAVFAYLGITLTLAQGFLVRRAASRMSEAAMALFGGATAIGGFGLLAYAATSGNFSALLIAMAVEVVGFAFVNPSLQSLISRRSSPEQQGGILGLGQSASSLARILGPVGGPALLAFHAAAPYYLAAGLMVAGVGLIALAARRGQDFGERADGEPG